MEYQITGCGYSAIARRIDLSWGHSIRVDVFDTDLRHLGWLLYACHPEFDGFHACQQMSSEALIAVIETRLQAGMAQNSFAQAWDLGIGQMFHLNSPDQDLPNIDPLRNQL